jgi:isoquinoline 1-oxidoreductase alpha subunit
MAAAALLKRNATPTDKDIDTAMQGHICRCGTYPRIRKAIKTAATLASSKASKG